LWAWPYFEKPVSQIGIVKLYDDKSALLLRCIFREYYEVVADSDIVETLINCAKIFPCSMSVMSTSSDTDVHVSFSLSETIKVSDILPHTVLSSDSTVLFGSLKSCVYR
jgi:hypothetical protein